jgi:hypothetical protein
MKTTSQKNSFGMGYGINRNVSGGKALQVAEPPLGNVTVKPGSGIVMPGSPKTGYKIRPAKVIGGKS